MLDDDDLDFAILAAPGWGVGIVLAVVALLGIAAIAFVVHRNHDECARRHCPDGQAPRLTSNACLCVTEATK